MRLADTSSKRIGTWAGPAMNAAVAKLGESVNLAVLDGDEIVYVAQSQAANNFMRMFTEVGRRTTRTPPRWERSSWPRGPTPKCWHCSSAPGCLSTPSRH